MSFVVSRGRPLVGPGTTISFVCSSLSTPAKLRREFSGISRESFRTVLASLSTSRTSPPVSQPSYLNLEGRKFPSAKNRPKPSCAPRSRDGSLPLIRGLMPSSIPRARHLNELACPHGASIPAYRLPWTRGRRPMRCCYWRATSIAAPSSSDIARIRGFADLLADIWRNSSYEAPKDSQYG